MSHFHVEDLICYIDGQQTAEMSQAIEDHAEYCPICSRTLRTWLRFLALLTTPDLVSPPEEVTQKCIAMFKAPDQLPSQEEPDDTIEQGGKTQVA